MAPKKKKNTHARNARPIVCRHWSGIGANVVDQKGLTALDTVKDMPSQKSRELAALILGEDRTRTQNLVAGRFPLFVLPFTGSWYNLPFVRRRSRDWKAPRP